jgi:hypothetical protein
MEEAAQARVPLGRFGEPPELANLAAFLMSSNAGFFNGEVVTIDGGEWLNGGEFNWLTQLPHEVVDTAFAAMRPKKGG